MFRFFTTIMLSFVLFLSNAQSHMCLSNRAQEILKTLYDYGSVDFGDVENDEIFYLGAYQSFLNYLSSENEELIDSFLIQSKQFNGSDFLHVNLEVQKAILLLLKGDELSGIYAFYRAYQIFERLNPMDNPSEYKKLNALFYVVLAQIPESYKFWSGILGLHGNESIGFDLLQAYLTDVKEHDFAYTEGLTLYLYLLLKFSEPSHADTQLIVAETKRIKSPLFNFVAIQVLMKAHQGHVARQLIYEQPNYVFKVFPLLYYLKGRLLVNVKGKDCIDAFEMFNSNFSGKTFKVDAQLRQAWYYHLNQQIIQRDLLVLSINESVKPVTALDRQAIKEASSLSDYPEVLLRARLFFDDGSFDKTNQLLATIDVDALKDRHKVEYYYRLARNQHLLRNYDKALSLYSKTILLAEHDFRYFGPYAAINAAEICCDKMADLDSMNFYINRAKKLNDGEYQSEVKRKIRELELCNSH